MDIDDPDRIGVDYDIGPDEPVKRVEGKFKFTRCYNRKSGNDEKSQAVFLPCLLSGEIAVIRR